MKKKTHRTAVPKPTKRHDGGRRRPEPNRVCAYCFQCTPMPGSALCVGCAEDMVDNARRL
jgi:hypothetical protein